VTLTCNEFFVAGAEANVTVVHPGHARPQVPPVTVVVADCLPCRRQVAQGRTGDHLQLPKRSRDGLCHARHGSDPLVLADSLALADYARKRRFRVACGSFTRVFGCALPVRHSRRMERGDRMGVWNVRIGEPKGTPATIERSAEQGHSRSAFGRL
jgi:hypothetical protein